jgi:deoxyribonuclease V
MEIQDLHGWDVSPEEAIALQRELAVRVRLVDEGGPVRRVAGVDVSFPSGGEVTRAAVVVLSYPELTLGERAVVEEPTRFPYVPGLLSFRETPTVLAAFRRIEAPPDLVVVDGQGIAHPRRLGIAAHLGLWLDLPTIGCAKSRLTGSHAPVGEAAGEYQPLRLPGGEIGGAVVRTKARTNPLYVSPGHRVSVDGARDWVLRLCRGYRLPEPTRQAHLAAA